MVARRPGPGPHRRRGRRRRGRHPRPRRGPRASPAWPSCCPGCRPVRHEPTPIGVFRAVERPDYGAETHPAARRGPGARPGRPHGPAALPPDLAGLTVARDRGRHQAPPAWWSDAKLGIFVHWAPSSVAGWAPTDHEIGDLLASGEPDHMARVPYTEWYENSLRYPDSPVARHHRAAWGDRPYEAFAADFEAGLEQWDPQAWAERFRDAGARYVVLVSKHHDGFCLWPTGVANPHRPGWHIEAGRGRRAGRGGPGRGPALRPVLLGRARLDLRGPAGRLDRRGRGVDPAGRLPGLRRGPRP